MLANTQLSRSSSKVAVFDPNRFANADTSTTENDALQLDKMHETVIQIDSLMPHLEALAVDRQQNKEDRSLEKSAKFGPGQTREKASAESSERVSTQGDSKSSKSSKSASSSSTRSSDSDSSTSSAAAAWTYKPSARTQRLQAICERLLAEHEKDTQFGSAWQTWWNFVSAHPIYDIALMLPVGVVEENAGTNETGQESQERCHVRIEGRQRLSRHMVRRKAQAGNRWRPRAYPFDDSVCGHDLARNPEARSGPLQWDACCFIRGSSRIRSSRARCARRGTGSRRHDGKFGLRTDGRHAGLYRSLP
jgi:hypothetical protein